MTPFEVIYGRKPKLPVDLLCPSIETPHLDITAEGYVGRLQEKLKRIYNLVNKQTEIKVEKMKFLYDRKVRGCKFIEGDRVWVKNTVVKKGKSKKLTAKWKGPYTIIRVISELDYQLKPDKGRKLVIVHRNLLKRCYSMPMNESKKRQSLERSNRSLYKLAFNEDLSKSDLGTEISVANRLEQSFPDKSQEDTLSENKTVLPNTIDQPVCNDEVREFEEVELEWDHQAEEEVLCNESQYEPNNYFKKQLNVGVDTEKTPRPKRNTRKPDRLNYE